MQLLVTRAGFLTTIQDLGRKGARQFGVSAGGALDPHALRVANLLVGNDPGAAALESTLVGTTLVFARDVVVAVTGAGCETVLDGALAPFGEAFRVPSGATLRVGRAITGVRSYLALGGGIDLPPVLGSRSTHVAAQIGGLAGRRLVAGDILPVGVGAGAVGLRRLRPGAFPASSDPVVMRAVPGPHAEAFSPRGIEAFYGETFTVSPRSDRTGVRLEGVRVEHAGSAEIDPEGVVTGAVQIPGDGTPIVLGPDRPVTGGYATIAVVIAADLPLLAQARPGATIRFVRVTVDEARDAFRGLERSLATAFEDVP